MATAQPIGFRNVAPTFQDDDTDTIMGSGSYMGSSSGPFNPASYTRHFLGSPISFRAGSFGNRTLSITPTSQIVGPLDASDFHTMLSTSLESDKGSLRDALQAFERQDEICKDFTCCGLHLEDLHALLEHFEEAHVVVLDQQYQDAAAPQQQPSAYLNVAGTHASSSSSQPFEPPTTEFEGGGFDPDDMEMDLDNASLPSSCAPSPPETPITTPITSFAPSTFARSHSLPGSSCSSPQITNAPVSAFDITTVMPSRGRSTLSHVSAFRGNNVMTQMSRSEAFNNYAAYADYSSSLPGTVPSPPSSSDEHGSEHSMSRDASAEPESPYPAGVQPAMLFSSANTPATTPSSSRLPSPNGTNANGNASTSTSSASSSKTSGANSNNVGGISTTLHRPGTTLLLSKPFRCPKPNCNKSYKQANGLKYHMTHGSCNYAPPKDLEQVQALIASKRAESTEAGNEGLITESELRELEREAERRCRPFACGIGECGRRYKNMNGLRYHYQHSGDHGAIGLALLASGQHESLQHHGRTTTPSLSRSTSMSSGVHNVPPTPATTTTATLQYAQQPQQQQQQQRPQITMPFQPTRQPSQSGSGQSSNLSSPIVAQQSHAAAQAQAHAQAHAAQMQQVYAQQQALALAQQQQQQQAPAVTMMEDQPLGAYPMP